MARTYRRDYRGRPIRDGGHGKRCPSKRCNWCGGESKMRWNRKRARRVMNTGGSEREARHPRPRVVEAYPQEHR